jgi:hypothetical protein
MRTLSHSVCVAFVALLASRGLADPPAGAGQILLLDNRQVLEGVVERVGEQYRVRRDGGETFVPAGRALAVCPDRDAVYRFLRDRTDTSDAEARLSLARWCDANGLRAQAAAEAKAAVDLEPLSRTAQATYQQFKRKAAVPAPVSVPDKLPASVVSVTAAEPIDCGAEAFGRFATKVDLVLMNACASCHAGENAGKFRLRRVYADSLTDRQAVQMNLAAALAQIDRARPAASPLLHQATTAHGGSAVPPLRDRGVPAYRQLDEWVRLVLGDTSPAPAPPAPPDAEITAASATKPAPEAKGEFGVGTLLKDAPATPADPFDPAEFNRQNHPNGPKPKE